MIQKEGISLEIRQLEYFLAVSKTGSFTRAAEHLYVSQPAVTNAIRSLEEELGIQLFDRNQKLATLTAEGKIFSLHVQQVMHGISQTIAEVDAMKNLSSGVLNIGLTSLGGVPEMAELLAAFSQQYPDIQCNIKEGVSGDLERLLIDDQVDVALLTSESEGKSLSYLPLPKQELVVCCSEQHALHRKNSVKLTELVDERIILLPTTCKYRQQVVDCFAAQDCMPKIAFEAEQVQTIKSFVAAGIGLAILPESLCREDRNLSLISLEPALYYQPLLAWKTNRHPSHALEAFLAIAKTKWEESSNE